MNYTNILKLKNKFNSLSDKKELREAAKVGDLLIDEYYKCKLTNSRKYADDIFDIACINDENGNMQKAEELYQESGRIYKRICGKDAEYAYRLNNLAIIYSKTGRRKEALQLFKESYRLRFNLLGYKSKETGESLYNLGNAYYDMGDYERSLHYLRQALKSWDKKSENYIDNINSIGYTLDALGETDKALEQLHTALGLIGETDGVLSMEYLKNLYFVANVYYENGDYEKAKDYMELFVTITSKVIGEKHPYILKGMERISETLQLMNDDERALEYRLKIMKLTAENIGRNHVFYCDCLSSAALLYKKRSDYEAAEDLLKESLSIRLQLTGRDHIGYLKDLILIAGVHFEMGREEDTVKEITSVIDIIENNNELFNEVLVEMIQVFMDFDGMGLTEEEKKLVFDNVYKFISDGEFGRGFNWRMFDDFS